MTAEGANFRGYSDTTLSRKTSPRASMRDLCLLLGGDTDNHRQIALKEVQM